jgi:hypothetical protein
LKRIIIIGTALCALVGATVAYGATTLNHYSANINFSTSKAGSASKPVAIGYTETLSASNATTGLVAAPLVDIKTTISNARSNLKDFKTCSWRTISSAPRFNAACPKGSEIATGVLNAEIGGPTLAPASAIACNPDLAVYNAGGGKEWYFFTTKSAIQCGGLTTGSTAPYPAKVTQQGKNLVIDVPLPSFVSTAVAGHTGLYGSLTKETLKVSPMTTQVNGKTVGATEAIGCTAGKRNWSVAFTAVPGAGQPGQTVKTSGAAKC